MNPSEQELSYSREVRSNAEDVALIRRMCDADETALGALYDRWARSLYSLVFHLLKDADEGVLASIGDYVTISVTINQ